MVRRLLLTAGLSLPALLVLGAAPAVAATPGLIWLPVCSGGDTHWLAIPRDPGQPNRDDRPHNLCAHATCARETKLVRKPRLSPGSG